MKSRLIIFASIFFGVIFLILLVFTFSAPSDFPANSQYTIEKGLGLNYIAQDLFDEKIIRSPFFFKVFSVLLGGSKGVRAGDYILFKKQNVLILAYRFARGDFGLTPVTVTLPEGLNVSEMGKLLATKFPKITETDFKQQAESLEGYLFPDTYLFLPNVTTAEVIKTLQNNFSDQIKTIETEI
jgi:UPF0755 protein